MAYQKLPNEVLIQPQQVGWNPLTGHGYTAGAYRATIGTMQIGGIGSAQGDYVAVGDATLPDGTVVPGTSRYLSGAISSNLNTALIAEIMPFVQATPGIVITG